MKAIARFKIANCFEPGEEITFTKLAGKCGLNEKSLRHLLRHAMTMRIFKEPRKGVVAHTAASAFIRDSRSYSWLLGGVEDLWPSSVQVMYEEQWRMSKLNIQQLVDALTKWPNSEEPNHTVCVD